MFTAVVVALASMALAESKPYAAADPLPQIRRFADNLIEHTRDKYGPKHTPLFVCQLDIDTKALPPADSRIYACRSRGGAGAWMNNLQFDSGRLRLLYALSEVTGDKKYAGAADEYLRYYLANLPEEGTGLFPWGDHRGYDVVEDETIKGSHEFKLIYPPWDRMYRINPKAVTRAIESLKLHIIDESRSYGFNRHYPRGGAPHSMNSSGGAYIVAWAFLYKTTGREKYLEWANRMADYLWSLRNPKTDLLAAMPYDPAYPDGYKSKIAQYRLARTDYMGQMTWYSANLLRASQLLGPSEGAKFRRQALAFIRAFSKRFDVQEDGSFHANFDLASGKPLFDQRITEGWQIVRQANKTHWVPTGIVGIRAPISLAFAHKMTGESDLREMFDRFIPLFQIERFEKLDGKPEPISAGLLSQAIVAFLNMYQASGEKSYLDQAQLLCRYAMARFYVDGWFVCGEPTVPRYRDPKANVWRLYSNRGGSNDLALAMLRVHLVGAGKPDIVDDDPFCYF